MKRKYKGNVHEKTKNNYSIQNDHISLRVYFEHLYNGSVIKILSQFCTLSVYFRKCKILHSREHVVFVYSNVILKLYFESCFLGNNFQCCVLPSYYNFIYYSLSRDIFMVYIFTCSISFAIKLTITS